jgi:hypothetical protein
MSLVGAGPRGVARGTLIERFLSEYIRSLEHLELMLFLGASPLLSEIKRLPECFGAIPLREG